MKILALCAFLFSSCAHAADTCETRSHYAYIAAKEARRMPLTLVIGGLQQHVQEHPEQWTTLDIQMALRAMIFGYSIKEPERAKQMELEQCEKERET